MGSKHEDLSSIPQNHVNNLNRVAFAVILALGSVRDPISKTKMEMD